MNAISLLCSGMIGPFHTANIPGAGNASGSAIPDAVSGGTAAGIAAAGMRKSPEAEPLGSTAPEASAPANTDRYTPEEKPDEIGRYWPGADENGRPVIFRDGPRQSPVSAALPKEQPGPDAPGYAGGASRPDRLEEDITGSAGEGAPCSGKDPLDSGKDTLSRREDSPSPADGAVHPNRPEKAAGEAEEKRCTVNTDRVDREIEKLKEEQQELKRRLRGETDAAKAETAQRRLEQVERELSQKDNDAYRRQNSSVTYF